ncbi:MAG TPA: hypothetical protein VIH91_09580 [Terriglobales bacterium]
MKERANAELDHAVREALIELHQRVCSDWSGRERELVSLFAFGYLATFFSADNAILKAQAQIGIEVAVKQTGHLESMKTQVCKDLVVWREPAMTAWDGQWQLNRTPLCVMQWKCITPLTVARVNKKTVLAPDVDWLKKFTEQNNDCIGFSVLADLRPNPRCIACDRFESGTQAEDWLVLSG